MIKTVFDVTIFALICAAISFIFWGALFVMTMVVIFILGAIR